MIMGERVLQNCVILNHFEVAVLAQGIDQYLSISDILKSTNQPSLALPFRRPTSNDSHSHCFLEAQSLESENPSSAWHPVLGFFRPKNSR